MQLDLVRCPNMIFGQKKPKSLKYLTLKIGWAEEYFDSLQENDSRWRCVDTEAKFLVWSFTRYMQVPSYQIRAQ